MDTHKRSQQKTSKIDDFLDALELEEPANDVPVSGIKSGEAAYQEYLAGRDLGKSLDACKSNAWMR